MHCFNVADDNRPIPSELFVEPKYTYHCYSDTGLTELTGTAPVATRETGNIICHCSLVHVL